MIIISENFNKIVKISTIKELSNYISENFYKLRAKEISDYRNIVLFGAGFYGRSLLKNLREKDIQPIYFCDNDKNKWGSNIDGLYVLPPDFIKNDIVNTLVVICTMSINKSIVVQLEKMKVEYLFGDSDGTLGNMSAPNLCKNINKLNEVCSFFIDDFSKKVYLNIIKARIFQNFSFELSGSLFTHSIITGPQYFDNQFFKYQDNEVFLDCGAYDGDSIVEFFAVINSINLKNCKAYAFEPDKINYKKVLKTIKEYNLENVQAFNYGVSNYNNRISMQEIQNCRHTNEEYETEICRIDDIIEDTKVTFIKMDIEGFELDALKGAENIIKKYKPKLAISIYHSSADLYEIPLYIKSIVPEYKLFVRHHSYNTYFETICYAYVDKE